MKFSTFSLAPLLATVVQGATLQHADSFVKYFDYTGDLTVTGRVHQVSSVGTTQTVYATLAGLDPRCVNGEDPTTANSCGIHIHAGMNCTGNALGHYFKVAPDPWLHVFYNSTDGKFTGNVAVDTGFTADEITGHAFLVHDYGGKRVACALLAKAEPTGATQKAPTLVKYPGYAGTLVTTGSVDKITTTAVTQSVTVTLSGLDPACKDGADANTPNSCGIHIHAGTSCATAAEVGGHFFNSALTNKHDPWLTVSYTSDASGALVVGKQTEATTGYTASDITGRAFVVHDRLGTRIACAVLVDAAAAGSSTGGGGGGGSSTGGSLTGGASNLVASVQVLALLLVSAVVLMR